MPALTEPNERGQPETVGLITPSYRGDLDRCELLFESIDRHIAVRGQHYVIVHDEDVPLFERFRRHDRQILPVSAFLPQWLRHIPFLKWKGRQYWWTSQGWPISGWHSQQIVKIQAAASLPEQRFCIVDSDNVFFKDFDLAPLALPNSVPLHVYEGGIRAHRPRHMKWIETASRLLGTVEPSFPADDYIDQIIVWDQATVQGMIARMESVSGRDWVAAMCRDRDFSEYMIYGAFVESSAAGAARHTRTSESFTRTHWDADELSAADILAMLRAATPRECAFCIQSFGSTPLATIRTALAAFYSENSNAEQKIRMEAA
ncbi:DUF6492 family protein [Methylobacterium brachythecii]|uniref:Uncharacterized protein n=1 Tax=Methylobacterium brachythecii TaxID=1176177 RepID=A0A7W6ANK7_9HYPH|nr:DUF6492 family protein [Methylobacterium brachythecii]MBB3904574.1 hypothetical protein [Methylobacterium brachythecii]GLS46363.1 hypothetical protein GCM10007884_43570 [Methylobacterium brachythecii]